MFLDQLGREPIVAGGHRCVRREHDLLSHAAHGFVGADAFGRHAMPYEFERGECAVTFIQVNDAGRDTHRRQSAHATDAEQQFLADPDTMIATVQARSQLTVFG